MRCRWGCPVHNRKARRRMRRFVADVQAAGHVAWAQGLLK